MVFRFMSNASTATAIVLVSVVFVAPDPASACSCAVPTGVSKKELARQELSDSDAVFTGEVTGIGLPPSGTTSTEPMTVTLRVSEEWKGAAGETVDVRTAASEVSCGFPFSEGVSYLVFASEGTRNAGGLEVGLCGSTRPLSEAGAALAMLGPGVAPTDPHGPARLPDTSGASLGDDRSLLLAAGILALVSAAAVIRLAVRGRTLR